jgi:hypothetical protein
MVKFDKQPVDLKAQAFVNAVKPNGATTARVTPYKKITNRIYNDYFAN